MSTAKSEIRIIVIEDDARFRAMLERRLKGIFPDSSLVSFDKLATARAFLKGKGEQPFDLVIIDEHLPDGSGAKFLEEGWFNDIAVLSMSSDSSPEMPGKVLASGATFFLRKEQLSEPLFEPLTRGLLQRNKLMSALKKAQAEATQLATVRTLLNTLKHEINNPLGAVLGAAHLVKLTNTGNAEMVKVAELIEQSGKRIHHVLKELEQASATNLKEINKSGSSVYQIPGDKEWK